MYSASIPAQFANGLAPYAATATATAEQYAEMLRDETARNASIVKAANIKFEN